jgi:ABC-type Fe3+ transport system substrate-binding protein
VIAAKLPKATQAMLAKGGFDASILTGLDRELTMPKTWFDGAKNEPKLKILASWDPAQFDAMSAPFRERYPAIALQYTRGSSNDRSVKTVVAYNSGRYIADIVNSVSPVGWIALQKSGGLTDLRVLPNFDQPGEETRDSDGTWVGQRLTYRCMAYNTEKIGKSDLPKTWDDLVTDPVWRNGTLGFHDQPSLWLAMLWQTKGPDWTTGFMTRLFKEVKPQLRKEGADAVVTLTAAGEIPAVLGAADYRVAQLVRKGAPIAWHCPDPIPTSVSLLIALRGSPAANSALIFINWFLSKEGQVAQFVADGSIPVHKDLTNDPRFLLYPNEVIGKQPAIRNEANLPTEFPKLMAVYTPLASGAGGVIGKSH